MTNETVAVYDPRLLDDIPSWVIENIQAVSAYMKTHGHEDWTIAGVRSQAAHDREVDRAVANERVRDVHTCHDQCTKTELCRMTRRAEAAEADARRFAWWMSYDVKPISLDEFKAMAARKATLDELRAAIDAAMASGGEG